MKKKIISIVLVIVSFMMTISMSGCFVEVVPQTETTTIDYVNIVNKLTLKYMSSNITITNKLEYRISKASATYEGSGVIFKKEKNSILSAYKYKYYVLTNNHVIAKIKSKTYGNVLSQTLEMQDYRCIDLENVTNVTSELVTDEIRTGYDLGVLTFESDQEYTVISFSTSVVANNTVVFAIGQPNCQRNAITIGKVNNYSSEPSIIYNDDGTENEYSQIKQKGYISSIIDHSAYIYNGSSGGALFDSNCQLIGINYAGTTSKTSSFLSGFAISVKDVKAFITKLGITIEE